MNGRPTFAVGALAMGLAAVCCALPVLVVGLGAAGISAWFSNSGAYAIPGLLTGAGLAWLWFYRRSKAADCCAPAAERQEIGKEELKS